LGISVLENEIFTDLDFADDVALLTEIFEMLVLALTVMDQLAQNQDPTDMIIHFHVQHSRADEQKS